LLSPLSSLRLWSLASHECVTLLPHQRSPVCALAWHGRRRQLLSACEDRTLRVWELASDGRGATASCVGLVPAAADDDGAESDDALPSYALAICPAPNGFDLICGLDDGSLVVLL
jgi:WD40 repeat protein